MKKHIFFTLLAFGLLSQSCKKDDDTGAVTGKVYQGVVIRNICCQIVVQSLGPDYIGQLSWVDSNSATRIVYSHVFKVSNACQFGDHPNGDTINFKVVDQQAQNCACCLLYVSTPVTAYPIEVAN